ncbi:hypothetical protein SeMB42_g07708 [Synchytrium endobioticum]|uniref:Uncharacterized protein n=1 Tax=Synchytrium endobioticum TaxID=286115 RepID=A0A507BWB1_9FUNG|nr:hypothetical protein SeMB42_g07708 [Synchytrium endobioticum]
MGIPGLHSFIASHPAFATPYQFNSLSDRMVIDGNSLLHFITRSTVHHNYGRYNMLAHQLILSPASSSLTIFDGALPPSKKSVRLSRFLDRIRKVKSLVYDDNIVLGPLAMNVALDTLPSTTVAKLEADGLVAQIARREGSPILSFDSDYYIFKNVKYVPLDSVVPSSPSSFQGRLYTNDITRKVLNLPSANLLPAFAVLVGCDNVVDVLAFKSLSTHIPALGKGRTGNQTKSRITTISSVLARCGSHDSITALTRLVSTADCKDLVSVAKSYMDDVDCGEMNTQYASDHGNKRQYSPRLLEIITNRSFWADLSEGVTEYVRRGDRVSEELIELVPEVGLAPLPQAHIYIHTILEDGDRLEPTQLPLTHQPIITASIYLASRLCTETVEVIIVVGLYCLSHPIDTLKNTDYESRNQNTWNAIHIAAELQTVLESAYLVAEVLKLSLEFRKAHWQCFDGWILAAALTDDEHCD